MEPISILLDSIPKIKLFVNDIHKLGCDFKLIAGKYVIDSKLVMSSFCLDLSEPIQFVVQDKVVDSEKVRKILEPYII